MTVGPVAFDADRLQNFDNAEDFFDARDAVQGGLAGIKKSGAKKGDSGVFGSIDGDFAMEFVAAADAKTLPSGVINRENLGTEGLGEFLNHFKGDVLAAFLDTVDGGLRGADFLG